MECIWSAETGLGSHPDHKRSRPPYSTYSQSFRPVREIEASVSAGINNLSPQLRSLYFLDIFVWQLPKFISNRPVNRGADASSSLPQPRLATRCARWWSRARWMTPAGLHEERTPLVGLHSPLLATSCPSFSVCFPCSSPIPGLIWFGSVYLVTTAGFVADQLM